MVFERGLESGTVCRWPPSHLIQTHETTFGRDLSGQRVCAPLASYGADHRRVPRVVIKLPHVSNFVPTREGRGGEGVRGGVVMVVSRPLIEATQDWTHAFHVWLRGAPDV